MALRVASKNKKSGAIPRRPLAFLRWLTVGQWEAIDNEYLDRGESTTDEPNAQSPASSASASASASKSKKKGAIPSKKTAKKKSAGDELFAPRNRFRFDWRIMVVLVACAVSLSFQEYYGDRTIFASAFKERKGGSYFELESFGWWTGWRFIGYLVFPMLVVLLMKGERIRDYYIRPKNFIRHLPIYIGLFLLVLPAVLIAAKTDSFKLTYPFYKLSNRSSFDFWAWQAMYWVQFISLEFFFRGFMLKALAPRFGSGAIFVMIVPYCMIHFGKPLPETLGAIIAGVVLGTLAMRTKSIWGGAFIHIAVALTMDSLAVSDCPPAESGLRCPSH